MNLTIVGLGSVQSICYICSGRATDTKITLLVFGSRVAGRILLQIFFLISERNITLGLIV